MLKKIKNNKYFILATILILVLICISFFQFYRENFSYVKDYKIIKTNCYEEKDPNHEYCKAFKDRENLEKYVNVADPKKLYKTYDVITLTCTIVENTIFSALQYFSPLIIALVVLGSIHTQFSSGMFENYLLRMKYSKYLKVNYKIAIKAALITPISLVVIFILSSIFSGFNFSLSNVDTSLSVYSQFKYNNFFLYGFIICVIQFFISLLYANISLCCCKQNKNKLVAIIMSYVVFIIVDIIVYIVIYAMILNKIFGLREMTDYFNIAGYWFFGDSINCFIPLIISFILQMISFGIVYKSFKSKEQVVLAYEKQVS